MPVTFDSRRFFTLLAAIYLTAGCAKIQNGEELEDQTQGESLEFVVEHDFRSVNNLEPRRLTETLLSCFSAGGKKAICGYPKRLVKAKVLEKYSGASCSAGTSFGIESSTGYLWVDKGCRAKFAVYFVAAESWQNTNRYDVNDDGFVNQQDRLDLIGELNRRASPGLSYELGERPAQLLGAFWDINNDKVISPKDVLEFDNYLRSLKCPSGTQEDKGTCLLVKPYVNGLPWYSNLLCEQYGLSLAYYMDQADCEATSKSKVNLFGYPSLGTCVAVSGGYGSRVQYLLARCNMIR